MELPQGYAAKILLVQLENGRQPGQLVEFDPPAALFPEPDRAGADAKRIGNVLLREDVKCCADA